MESQTVDHIIASLPHGFTQNVLNQQRQEREMDDIVRNLPPDFDQPPQKKRKSSTSNTGQGPPPVGPPIKRKAIDTVGPVPKRIRKKIPCPTCGKEFGTDNMAHHRRTHQEVCYACPNCDYNTRYFDYLRDTHFPKFHPTFKCKECSFQYADTEAFFDEEHLERCIRKCRRPDKEIPPEPLSPPEIETLPTFLHDSLKAADNLDAPFWQDPLLQPWLDDDQAVTEIRRLWKCYRQRFNTYDISQEYHFRLAGTDVNTFTFTNAMKYIYNQVKCTFLVNVGTSVLLRRENDDGTSEFRIFVAQNNRGNMFERNLLIHDIASLKETIQRFEELNDLAEITERPSTQYKLVAVLGLSVYIYLRPTWVAGRGDSRLPAFLTLKKKHLITMERDSNWNAYTDNACLFRCILAGKGQDYHDKDLVQQAFNIYRTHVPDCPEFAQFQGVPEDHIPLLETLFQVNINIYRQPGPKDPVQCLRQGTHLDWPTVHVHSHPIDVHHVHFSWISNLDSFAGRHRCEACNKYFNREDNLKRHVDNNCNEGKPKHIYPGGCYEAPLTVFDKLTEFGIVVDKDRRRTTGLICWDIESYLQPCNDLKYKRVEMDEVIEQRLNNQNIQLEYYDEAKGQQTREKHHAVTAALKSTVPGFEEVEFLVNEDEDLLVNDIVEKMIEISEVNYELEKERFEDVIDQLEGLRRQAEEAVNEAGEDKLKKFRERATLNKIKSLQKAFDTHCKQTTVLHFNGGRYDLNVVKKFLYPRLVAQVREARTDSENKDDEHLAWPKTIARGGTVLCLATEQLRFVDVMMFCGPGTSLKSFMDAYCTTGQKKMVFPYEALRRPEDLERIVDFPPKSTFFSTLKMSTVTDEEYEEAKAQWDQMPVKNLLSYIKLYNCCDVEPFLNSCMNMAAIMYKDLGIDIYKECLSLPGVTLKYLFSRLHQNHPTARFGLFDEKQADLCQEFYKSMLGGLSVIVQRQAEAGVTPIRGNDDVKVKRVVGYDFNALYLWALGEPMPTGYPDHFVLDGAGENFERKTETMEEMLKARKHHGESEYLKYRAFTDQVYIHQVEHGVQTSLTIKQYRVDGFAREAKPKPRVYDYRGCRYHHHTPETGCLRKKVNTDGIDPKIIDQDVEKERELKAMGFDVDITWECEFWTIKNLARDLRTGYVRQTRPAPELLEKAKAYNEFLTKHPPRPFDKMKTVTYQDMKKAILDRKAFGFVLADVATKPELYEDHEDFPCVIKHAQVARDDVGDLMKEYAEKNRLLEKPRDCLINSFHGQRLWLMSPMLVWLQEHGIECQKIHEVVLYDEERVFEDFVQTVTAMRERGDKDKSLELLALLYKLLGNSAYGKCLTRIDRHMETYFCDATEAAEAHNDPLFHKSIQIADDCFQVSKFKKEIRYALPLQIGLAVYSYSKIRMLSFLYDVLYKFVPKSQFDFLESDTDSIYLALATNELKAAIPKEKMTEFEKIEKSWFVVHPSQKRVPGLLKVEKTGSKYCGLCSKCYIVVPEEGAKSEDKVAAKGVQLKRNAEILTYENFVKVLNGEDDAQTKAFNIGIREMPGEGVVTYVQMKTGLTRAYFKRRVVENNRTLPLLI